MDSNRSSGSSDAVNKLLGNISAERQPSDDQYIKLNYPHGRVQENWRKLSNSCYMSQFDLVNNDNRGYVDQQFNQQMPFNYLHQQLYTDSYDKHKHDVHNRGYDMYQTMQTSSVQDVPRYTSDYNLWPHNNYMPNRPETMLSTSPEKPQSASPQLIENLVGNWVPTTTGTYSPFGNMSSYQPKLFENDIDSLSNHMVRQVLEEPPINPTEYVERIVEENPFPFTRDTKKPRMVAEVKPMRPSYSDVLLKSAPHANTTKPGGKVESKDNKQKKEVKKTKECKVDGKQAKTSTLNKSTTAEIKDVHLEKNLHNKSTNEKNHSKDSKTGQLNRKWASLDNVNNIFEFKVEYGERKTKKIEDNSKNASKTNPKKTNKSFIHDTADTDSASGKNEITVTKTSVRKMNKSGSKQRSYEAFGSNDRPPGKRMQQRNRKKESHVPLGFVGQKLKYYTKSWWKMFVRFIFWLYNLISDICSLSVQLGRDMAFNFWSWFLIHWEQFTETAVLLMKRVRILTWIWEKIKREPPKEEQSKAFTNSGLQNNMSMPTTGEEAMKRLLACKGKDPYSILGVTSTCTDDDIKRYYKRQAFLVHPDKNPYPGAEEAFKILVHAFDMIGEPEKRATYDNSVAESAQVVQVWTELSDLLAQLQQKMDAAANTIRCSACGLRHKRIKVEKPCYAARNCTSCKIHHSAREGDIWAEAKCFGFLWHYYACMEGGVYDITDWAGCQKDSLKHLKPDSHHVQYRIALGKQNGGPPKRHNSSPRNERPPDLDHLLNNLYGQYDTGTKRGTRNKRK